MPRISKDDLVNDLLSGRRLEQEAMNKPIPDSSEWWQDVAQGLGVIIHDMRIQHAAYERALGKLPPCVNGTCLYSCADDECKKAVEKGILWPAPVPHAARRDELLARLTKLEAANDKLADGWDSWREARIVCEAIGSSNGVGTVSSALLEAFDAGRVFEARSHENGVADIANFVEHLRDGYQSTAEPVAKVARLIRERENIK